MITLPEFLQSYKQSFGGGMIPFDTAYHKALNEGHTVAMAQTAGVHAILKAFVVQYEAAREGNLCGTWVDAEGIPTDG